MERRIENGVSQEPISLAASAVSAVYERYFNRRNSIYPVEDPYQPDFYAALTSVSQHHSLYSSQIDDLIKGMQAVENVRGVYGQSINGALQAFGSTVANPDARSLLAKILIARTSTVKGHLRRGSFFDEAHRMAKEIIGSEDGFESGALKDISVLQIFKSVLSGELAVVSQEVDN